METFLSISIPVLVYVLSFWRMAWFIRIVYSKGGYWEKLEPCNIDLLVIFCPISNTALALISFFLPLKTDSDKLHAARIKKFFKIKR